MLQTIILIILTLVGVRAYPIFTLGCVLINYHHPILGVIIIIYSIFKDDGDKVEYID